MPLRPGELLEHYEVIEMIGSGGMGEVYRARDTRLPREVAIKVSSQAFNDRFAREARVIASLNHPNICTLFDVGSNYIVMELVQGDTLQDIIGKGSIPLDEASRLAKQIADALDYAHEHGVIHRDLKPANIKVRPDGVVKVLDFGMAKAVERANAEEAATVSMDATRAGSILGTPNYMSPEQAMGRSVDKRADTWAFGIVFYEMLAGEKPFGGSTVQEAIAATLRDAPDLNRVPSQVRRLLRKCLEKDPNNRLKHLGDVMSLVDEAPSIELPAGATATPPPPSARKISWLWPAIAAFGFALAATIAMIHFREVPEKHTTARFQVALPQGAFATPSGGFSVSLDGDILLAAADDKGTHWYLRRIDSTELRKLDMPVDSDPMPPAWSPDGRFVVYNYRKGALKGELATGQTKALCEDCTALGASWRPDGTILLGNVSNIAQISADGGSLTTVVKTDQSKGEAAVWPVWLPDGKHFLYTVVARVANANLVGVRVGSVDAKPENQSKTWLIERAMNTEWVPPSGGQSGYIIYTNETRDLVARPFNADKLEFVGPPVQLATAMPIRQNWVWSAFSTSSKGHLVYHRDGGVQQQPIWFDKAGKNLNTAGDPAIFQTVVMGPDGKHAALALTGDVSQDIWIADLTAGTRTRLTSEPVPDTQPVWSRDGQYIFYDSIRDNKPTIVRRAASGASGEQIIHAFPTGTAPTNLTDASPDGKLLVYHQNGPKSTDLWTLDLTKPDAQPQPLLQTEFQEIAARFSPDGKWYLYRSNESGRNEIYVQAVPGYGAPAGKFLISRDGALGMARWRKDGRVVYFLAPDGAVMTADVTLSPNFKSAPPTKMFDVPSAFRATFVRNPGTLVDITPDGERFLFAVPLQDAGAVPFEVTTDFRAGLAK